MVALTLGGLGALAQDAAPTTEGFHAFTLRDIDGKDVPMSQYSNTVVLVVNVASRCGFTKQYADLEALHKRFRDRGFAVLGVPSNDFGGQEPGSEAEIKQFCTLTFGVTFPMFAKVSVKGATQHPLYTWLTDKARNPAFGGDVAWNFTKFLIGRDGKVAARFTSKTPPLDASLVAAVEDALGPAAATPDAVAATPDATQP